MLEEEEEAVAEDEEEQPPKCRGLRKLRYLWGKCAWAVPKKRETHSIWAGQGSRIEDRL